MAKRKPLTCAKLADKAAVLLQRLRRLEESDDDGICTCITCGRRQHFSLMDGGHFISRTYTVHKLNPMNIHPQCTGCNGYKGSNPIAYTLAMIDKFSHEWVENMESSKRDRMKWNRADLNEMIEDLKHKIKEQEARLGPYLTNPD